MSTVNLTPTTIIEFNSQIIFAKGDALFVGRVVELREKAIKIDFFWQPIWSAPNGTDVYTYSTWAPKSQIVNDEVKGLICKKWFINNFKGHNIKKYILGSDGITQNPL